MPDAQGKEVTSKVQPIYKNKFDKREFAGAFGDLGTMIPFVVGYITVAKMDPLGVLFMFGIMLIIGGAYYKTPMPIQPMKAIGSAAITQAAIITPGMVCGAGLFTGLFWLTASLTGVLNFIAKITSKPVIRGITLGLGLSFILQGVKMMRADILVAVIALGLTFFLLNNKRIPAMFFLLLLGVAAALIKNPGLFRDLSAIHFSFRLPEFLPVDMSWSDFAKGALILGIPQIPLTLGNAVVAVTAENNRLFPDHPVTEKKVAMSQGIMNLIAPIFGGIPMCHGAGGMAGHVRFGARTGGATIILGVALLITGLCFSSSVLLIFKLFPGSVLGVILFFAGLEMAATARDINEKNDFYITLVTTGFAFWNMGAGFLAGLIMQELFKRKIFKV